MSESSRVHEPTKEEITVSESILSSKLTRRTFLKATAATGAVAAVGDKLFGGPVSALTESTKAAAQAATEDVWIKTCCHACDRNCGILVHRVNGVVVKVEGNPDDPDNAGKICARSNSLPMYLYNPYRVKAPVKRTNPEKGLDVDPKWVEISWDEAMDTIAQKLRAIREKDPRGLVVLQGHRAQDISLGTVWGRVFGTPTYNNSGFGGQTCHGCELHHFGGWVNGVFVAGPDTKYCNYILSFGDGMYMANKGTPGDNRIIVEAKQRGARFVSVDPVQAPSSRNIADEWIPIRPGTDIAFLLAMGNTIIHELGIYDVEFMKIRSNAPYLIGPDGLYVRAAETLLEDPARLNQEFGKPLIWDPVDAKAKTFDDPSIKDFALEGRYTVNDIECQPAFQLVKDHLLQYTPEWAASVTTVPANTIRRIAKEFVEAAQIGSTIAVDGVTMPYRPAACTTGRGVGVSAYGVDAGEARTIVNLLVGNINVPGGYISSYYGPPNMTADPVDGILQPGVGYYSSVWHGFKVPPQRADIQDLHPIAYKTHYLVWPAIVNPQEYGLDYEVEAMAVQGCNPLGGVGLKTIRAAFAKVPFIFTISYNFSEPEEWADVVLPDCSILERHQQLALGAGVWSADGKLIMGTKIRQPTTEKPVFNTREGNDILIDLCDRLGILYGEGGLNATINAGLTEGYQLDLSKTYKWADILDLQIRSRFGDEHGLQWFKENGLLVQDQDVKVYYGTPRWPTTRVPFYLEYIQWVGKELERQFREKNVTSVSPYGAVGEFLPEYHALPIYRDGPDSDAPAEYDLWVCHYKTMLHSMAMAMDNAWVYAISTEWNPYDMYLWMNADTAAKKGLKDGDVVWVESHYGKTQGEVKTSQCVHPEAVGIGGFFGLHSANAASFVREGGSWNELLALETGGGKFVNPVIGGNHMHVKTKVYKA
jgi:anaerobic selenocysteine-containing dehydrogenase